MNIRRQTNWVLITVVFLVFYIVSHNQISYAQSVSILPPVPLPDDHQQIKAVVSSMSRSLRTESIKSAKMLVKSILSRSWLG